MATVVVASNIYLFLIFDIIRILEFLTVLLFNVLAGKWKRGGYGPQGATRRVASSQWNYSAEDPAQLP